MAATPKAAVSRAQPWLAHYPSDVAWDQSFTPTTIPALFDSATKTFAAKTAMVFQGRPTSYSELASLVAVTAAGLATEGIRPGARVGLMLPNSPAYVIYFFAVLKLGAVVVNYNPLHSTADLAVQVKDSGTELMVTLDLKQLFDKAEALITAGVLARAVVVPFASMLPSAKAVLFRLMRGRDVAHVARSPAAAKFIPDAQLRESKAEPPAIALSPTDLAVLQYTGGTTGTPKGARLTHANLSINVRQSAAWSASLLKPGEERILAVLPFFHVFAMTGILLFGLSEGAEIVIQPRFQLDETVELIAKSRPTVMPGVPTLFAAIMSHKAVRSLDLKSLKLCLSGGAPLPAEVRKGFEQITGAKLVEAYGLTETSPAVTCNPLDNTAKAGSIGLPLPGTSISIRDPAVPTRAVPLGQPGEICIKGPQVMDGYWQRPDDTTSAFVDGYFRTGDVGYMDQDGFVFIVDRIKDVIIASGFKIYPRHVEEKIYEHPAIEEVTVIGIPDAYRGEVPKAFIKLKPGAKLTIEDLARHLDGRLSKIEMPTAVEFRDELPKTVIGKLSKKELKAEEKARVADVDREPRA
jgi:long-chain acyl-CoA synthetase